MRHQRKRHKLGRTASHRKATLVALSNALITHKRVTTTVPRAKALRTFIEPIITRAKDDSQHNRRQAFRHLRDKQAVTTLFTEVAEKIGERPGGYTRVVRIGRRAGDAAPMAIIELVDYNEADTATGSGSQKTGKRTRRGRRRSARPVTPATTPEADETPAVEAPEDSNEQEEAPEDSNEQEETPEEPAEEVKEAEAPVPEASEDTKTEAPKAAKAKASKPAKAEASEAEDTKKKPTDKASEASS